MRITVPMYMLCIVQWGTAWLTSYCMHAAPELQSGQQFLVGPARADRYDGPRTYTVGPIQRSVPWQPFHCRCGASLK